MPEAFAVLLVFAVTVFIYVHATLQSRHPVKEIAEDERRRAAEYRTWLQERLDRARRENWDDAMVNAISAQLRATGGEVSR